MTKSLVQIIWNDECLSAYIICFCHPDSTSGDISEKYNSISNLLSEWTLVESVFKLDSHVPAECLHGRTCYAEYYVVTVPLTSDLLDIRFKHITSSACALYCTYYMNSWVMAQNSTKFESINPSVRLDICTKFEEFLPMCFWDMASGETSTTNVGSANPWDIENICTKFEEIPFKAFLRAGQIENPKI